MSHVEASTRVVSLGVVFRLMPRCTRRAYGQRAGTFLSNAGVLQVFGVKDHDSARLISDLLGQGTIVFRTMRRALDAEEYGITLSNQHTSRALLTPDKIRNLPEHGQLLFLAG